MLTVKYGRLANLGNFENERAEVEISVGPEDNPQACYEEAQRWVWARLGLPQFNEHNRVAELYQQRRELEDLESRVTVARERWKKLLEWFQNMGLKPPENWPDELPF